MVVGDDRFFTPLRYVQNDMGVEGEDHPHPNLPPSRGDGSRHARGHGREIGSAELWQQRIYLRGSHLK